MVACTGKVRREGQNRLVSGNGVALLTGKDLTISGRASDESYFQGLVYTEGTFQANRVSIVGTLIAAGQNDQAVTLRQSRILQPPDSTVSVSLAQTAPPGGPASSTLGPYKISISGHTLEIKGTVTGNSVNLTGSYQGVTKNFIAMVVDKGTTPVEVGAETGFLGAGQRDNAGAESDELVRAGA